MLRWRAQPACVAALMGLLFAQSALADWELIGPGGFSTSTANYVAFAFNGSEPYVAYQDAALSNRATVMRYSGGSWQVVGTAGFSASTAAYLSLAFNNGEPYVAFQDAANSSRLTVMGYTGGAWQIVGSAGFSAGTATYASLGFYNGEPYVAFRDAGSSNRIVVRCYTGGSWQIVGGAGASPSTANYSTLAFYNGEPYVAYQDGSVSNKATVRRYSGGSWQTVGTAGFSAGTAAYLSLAFNGSEPYVLYQDAANANKATVMGYIGGAWQTIGTAGFSAGTATYNSLTFHNGEPYVLYQDGSKSNKATAMRYTGGAWQALGTAGFSAGACYYCALTFFNGEPYAAYRDAGYSNKATVSHYVWPPTTQATNLTFSGVSQTALNVAWVRGDGTACAVFMKQGSSGQAAPVNNTTYTAGSTFGSGMQIGATGWYCVYNGSGAGVSVTGLTPGSDYRVMVCEYTGSIGRQNYLSTAANGNPADVAALAAPPTVTTAGVTDITATTATCGGNVLQDGGGAVLARGVCWNTAGSPTTADSKTVDGAGTGTFTSSLTGLNPGVTYHVRAYAINVQGTSYGADIPFVTGTTPSVVVTAAVTNVGATTATCGGNVTADGGAAITARGVCWSTSPNPTTADSKTTDGTGAGVFTSNLTGLNPGVTYHVRAYATNVQGTSYGDDAVFTTDATAPVIVTAPATDVTATTATCGGDITADGGAAVTARGVCWNITGAPTTADAKTSDGAGAGPFASNLTGLSPGVTYHVRAYATNVYGTAYGNEIQFTTGTTLPAVVTAAVTDVTATAAVCGGNITSDGGVLVTERGVCWNTAGAPTTADDKTTCGTGPGAFTVGLTSLIPNTTYHARAYATNAHGTTYGNEVQFLTNAAPPTVITAAVVNITPTSAVCGGNVTADGMAEVTARGVCWNTAGNPTTADDKTADGAGLGLFVSGLTGLSPGVTYRVRAYASNAHSTAYGEEIEFVTGAAAPTVVTAAVTAVSATTATCGGNVTADGGAEITARGLWWSTAADPANAYSKTVDAAGTGPFTVGLTSLSSNTVYQARAFATNAHGTSFGDPVEFTTGDASALTPGLQVLIAPAEDDSGWSLPVGQDLRLLITVQNTGPADANHVTLVVPIPARTTYVSARVADDAAGAPAPAEVLDGTLYVDLEDLAAGAQVQVELVLQITEAGQITLSVGARSDEYPELVLSSPAQITALDSYYILDYQRVPVLCGATGLLPLLIGLLAFPLLGRFVSARRCRR